MFEGAMPNTRKQVIPFKGMRCFSMSRCAPIVTTSTIVYYQNWIITLFMCMSSSNQTHS